MSGPYKHRAPLHEGDWSSFEQGAQAWEVLLKKYGAYELERRMRKLPSYRAYQQRWPYDAKGGITSLDALIEGGYEQAMEQPDILDAIISDEAVREYQATLTVVQRQISDKLEQGYRPKEFYGQFSYPNTGGVRWHRYVMRKKHQIFKDAAGGPAPAETPDV